MTSIQSSFQRPAINTYQNDLNKTMTPAPERASFIDGDSLTLSAEALEAAKELESSTVQAAAATSGTETTTSDVPLFPPTGGPWTGDDTDS